MNHLVIFSAITLGLFLVVNVVLPPDPAADRAQQEARAVQPRSSLRNVEWDGHRFIEAFTSGGVSLAHHPDCPCLHPAVLPEKP